MGDGLERNTELQCPLQATWHVQQFAIIATLSCWVSLRSSDWVNHCLLMIGSTSTIYPQYSKGMGARSSSFITSNHILKHGAHQESPDWKKRYTCQPENSRVLRSFIFEIQGQRSNLKQKVWREGKVVHAFNHSMWKAETGWSQWVWG